MEEHEETEVSMNGESSTSNRSLVPEAIKVAGVFPSTTSAKASVRKCPSKASCCVPLCTKPGYVTESGDCVTFHVLPTSNKELLDKWIVKIRRDPGVSFKITKHTRICSRHFNSGDLYTTPSGRRRVRPGAVPTKFTWTKDKGRRVLHRTEYGSSPCPSSSSSPVPPEASTDPVVDMDTDLSSTNLLHQKIALLEEQLAKGNAAVTILKRGKSHIAQLLTAATEKAKQNNCFSIDCFKDSDTDICFYTGFPSYNYLYQCYRLLNPEGNILLRTTSGKSRLLKETKLSYLNQFFLTLVRLRLGGLMEKDLAHRFRISQSCVNKYFISWINYMFLKLGTLNIWPTSEQIQRTMPESMKAKFPNLEWIIDAFEIQSQRPKSLLLQSQSYSNYKSRNTVKGLIACTPSGQVGFVSQLYTGNISDRELVIRSGFLKMPHTKGAMWLVDKGFQIADLAEPLGVSVNMPAFVGCKSQMSAVEVFHTQSIASERIHIERVINKIKKIHYFDRPIQMSTYGTTNQVWAVCSLLTLFQNPVISA